MLYQEVTESYSAIYSVCEKDLIISDLKLDFLKMMKFLWLTPRCKKYADRSKCDILNDITLRRILNNSTDWTKKISCYDM